MIASTLAMLATATALGHGGRPVDPRIQQVAYDPAMVTTVLGCSDYQSVVAFGPGEQIENVALGNADLWQAAPNKRGDLLFLKPNGHGGRTNMMVVTDRRRYAFDLIARNDAECRMRRVAYELQFKYPAEPAPPAAQPTTPVVLAPPSAPAADLVPPPSSRNTAYTFTGAAANVPNRVFDDGRFTYLHWADGVSAPAIYTVSADKTEAVVNYAIKGDYLVIDRVAPRFVLRRGAAVAVLYNDAYQQPVFDADAPRPRQGDGGAKRSSALFSHTAVEKAQ